ncbi:MAG: hypothetical protein IPP00_13420 [Actinomycetales bacterium]|uniref:Uncharacterized protein n=1 Tax=Candidatus Phosphoribacter hodrii TaxID=2953743 RepID=A0A9D7XXS6_9MICO|nr:hypothetical protein [Candidatus Phosphoribacter hodrii]
MTIARERWQQHLKTQGGYYRTKAAELRAVRPELQRRCRHRRPGQRRHV